MSTLYKMFLDGTPLNKEQIKSLISAGLVVREGNQLKPDHTGIQSFTGLSYYEYRK